MTVAQLQQSMSHRELIQWQAYDQLDPIGNYRQDINTAWLAYLSHGDKGKTIEDFLIIDPNPMTDEQREQVQIAKQKRKLEQQTAKLTADFERVKIKGA